MTTRDKILEMTEAKYTLSLDAKAQTKEYTIELTEPYVGDTWFFSGWTLEICIDKCYEQFQKEEH